MDVLGFDYYYQVIDLANNPEYDFISYNIDPNIIIYNNRLKDSINQIYDAE